MVGLATALPPSARAQGRGGGHSAPPIRVLRSGDGTKPWSFGPNIAHSCAVRSKGTSSPLRMTRVMGGPAIRANPNSSIVRLTFARTEYSV
jgi:hypothetical protein